MGRPTYRLDQRKAPFLEGLVQYSIDGVIPFHTPGHKQGRALDPALRRALGDKPFLIDVSDEISDPHNENDSAAVLLEAEALAADAFGAERTFFLHNGTTAGIQAMLLAASWWSRQKSHTSFSERLLEDVATVAVPRSVHRSVFGGLILAGLSPRFVEENWDTEWNIPLPPSSKAWQAVAEIDDVVALLDTYPNYYGIGGDIGAIARYTTAGRLLLVDEAHGAHFGFHEALPPTALSLGAAAVAQSAHKTLGVLTQASFLHIGEPGLDELMSVVLSILQSTSPSFLLYASLDAGRRQMALEGYKLWQRALEMSQMARDSINRIRGLRCLDEEVLDKPGAHWWDPTKLLIRVDGIGMSGSEAERHLRQAGVQVELAGLNHILVLITIGDGPKEVDRLLQALRELGTARTHDGKKRLQPIPKTPSSGKMVLSPRQATLAPWREVVLGEARGKIAANSVTPYPPGIPLLVPGEEISDESIEYLRGCWQRGIEIRGWAHPDRKTIWVVDDD